MKARSFLYDSGAGPRYFFSFFLLADVAVVVAGGEGEVERRKSALCASIAEHLKPLRGKESERGREKERDG